MPEWNSIKEIYEENEWSVGDVVQVGDHYGIVTFFSTYGMTVCVCRGTGTVPPVRDVNICVRVDQEVLPHDGSKLAASLKKESKESIRTRSIELTPPQYTNISKQIVKRVPVSEASSPGEHPSP